MRAQTAQNAAIDQSRLAERATETTFTQKKIMRTVALLIASNLFMTTAWYGHLRYKNVAIWTVILVSWGIAFFEYCLQVPANRWGHGQFSAYQLKIMQEMITLVIFIGFSAIWLGETPRWNHLVAFVLILAAVGFAFLPRNA